VAAVIWLLLLAAEVVVCAAALVGVGVWIGIMIERHRRRQAMAEANCDPCEEGRHCGYCACCDGRRPGRHERSPAEEEAEPALELDLGLEPGAEPGPVLEAAPEPGPGAARWLPAPVGEDLVSPPAAAAPEPGPLAVDLTGPQFPMLDGARLARIDALSPPQQMDALIFAGGFAPKEVDKALRMVESKTRWPR
jgi:hypothetical protein